MGLVPRGFSWPKGKLSQAVPLGRWAESSFLDGEGDPKLRLCRQKQRRRTGPASFCYPALSTQIQGGSSSDGSAVFRGSRGSRSRAQPPRSGAVQAYSKGRASQPGNRGSGPNPEMSGTFSGKSFLKKGARAHLCLRRCFENRTVTNLNRGNPKTET